MKIDKPIVTYHVEMSEQELRDIQQSISRGITYKNFYSREQEKRCRTICSTIELALDKQNMGD